MDLIDALDPRHHDVIALVGGGGKTTLMFALADELIRAGQAVLTTTTTRIGVGEPERFGSPYLLVEPDAARLLRRLPEKIRAYGHITVVSRRLTSPGKLRGLSAQTIDHIAELRPRCITIVEADGAAHRPIKAPAPHEPVIPALSTIVIPVVGLDALGAPLDDDKVFRPEIVSRLTGLAPGKGLTYAAIATLLTDPEGIAKGSPDCARIIPVINKVDSDSDLPRARTLARRILAAGRPRRTRWAPDGAAVERRQADGISSRRSWNCLRTPRTRRFRSRPRSASSSPSTSRAWERGRSPISSMRWCSSCSG